MIWPFPRTAKKNSDADLLETWGRQIRWAHKAAFNGTGNRMSDYSAMLRELVEHLARGLPASCIRTDEATAVAEKALAELERVRATKDEA